MSERDRSHEILIIILWSPIGSFVIIFIFYGGVHNDRGRVIAFLQGGCVNDGFKGRTGLSSRMEGPVKLAFGEIPTSHNGFYITRFGIETEQSSLHERLLVERKDWRLVLFVGRFFHPHMNHISWIEKVPRVLYLLWFISRGGFDLKGPRRF